MPSTSAPDHPQDRQPGPDADPGRGPAGESAFVRASGLRLHVIGPDRVEGVIDLGPEHHQPWGIVHGGVYATAVESAASFGAAEAARARGLQVVGVHNSTNFLRPVRAGRVQVVALPIHQGRTTQLWEVTITDEQRRPVAVGQVRLQNLELRT